MQIRLLQAQAVKVSGDREGKLREARYNVVNLSWRMAFVFLITL